MVYTSARERLDCALSAMGALYTAEAVPLESYSNDAWRIGDHVVRVCWRGDIGRLRREAAVAALLPAEVPYPEILAVGDDGHLAWMVTRRMPGQRVDAVWPALDDGERRTVITQLAEVLRVLHAWRPPEPVQSLLLDHAGAHPRGPEAIVGTDLCPLPIERAQTLTAHADSPGLDTARSRLSQLAHLDPYRGQPQSVVHGDLHFANLLWHEGKLTAVLDFEWVRLGPPDLDLEPFLRSVDWAGSGDGALVPPGEMARVLGWLAAEYPQLFAHPRLVERLWLYQLAYTVRELYTWPPAAPEQAAADHPANYLPRFAQGPSHVRGLLALVPGPPSASAPRAKAGGTTAG